MRKRTTKKMLLAAIVSLNKRVKELESTVVDNVVDIKEKGKTSEVDNNSKLLMYACGLSDNIEGVEYGI